jgi:hypothetical protein
VAKVISKRILHCYGAVRDYDSLGCCLLTTEECRERIMPQSSPVIIQPFSKAGSKLASLLGVFGLQ